MAAEADLPRWAVWLGGLWAAPVSLVGVLIGLGAMLFGARFRREGVMWVVDRFPLGPGGAMTLGQVVLSTGDDLNCEVRSYRARVAAPPDPVFHECVNLGAHERAHVYQYFVLGPLFLPLYLLCGGVSARNPFEQAADRYAATGRGWWPWCGEHEANKNPP